MVSSLPDKLPRRQFPARRCGNAERCSGIPQSRTQLALRQRPATRPIGRPKNRRFGPSYPPQIGICLHFSRSRLSDVLIRGRGKAQPSKENVRVWWFDLNQFNRHRSKQVLVVEPLHPCPVGNDGEMFWYIRAGESWRPILLTTGDSLMADRPLDPWCPVPPGRARRANSAHGWPDLIIAQNISATERRSVCFRFDGKVYKEIQ